MPNTVWMNPEIAQQITMNLKDEVQQILDGFDQEMTNLSDAIEQQGKDFKDDIQMVHKQLAISKERNNQAFAYAQKIGIHFMNKQRLRKLYNAFKDYSKN